MTTANDAGDDDAVRAEDSTAALSPPDDDTFELEVDGQVHTVPAALKGAFLRQADYTRKTQELADHRRALEAERAALAEHAEAAHHALNHSAHVAALESQLASLDDIDWRELAHADPERAQALWALRNEYAAAMAHHADRAELHAQREAEARMAQAGQVLAREIDGWSPETAARLVDYAQTHGVSLEELKVADDPRVWKILHRAWLVDQAHHKDRVEKGAQQAQAVRPAVVVSGGAAGSGGVRDELATKEWMQRRNEAVRKGR